MALKTPKTPNVRTEVKAKLVIKESSLAYATAFGEQTGRSLDEVFSMALDQVLVPARPRKEKS